MATQRNKQRQTKKSQSKFHMEALEPRLLMAADMQAALLEQLSLVDQASDWNQVQAVAGFSNQFAEILQDQSAFEALQVAGNTVSLQNLLIDAEQQVGSATQNLQQLQNLVQQKIASAVTRVQSEIQKIQSEATDLATYAQEINAHFASMAQNAMALPDQWMSSFKVEVPQDLESELQVTFDLDREVTGATLNLLPSVGSFDPSTQAALRAGFQFTGRLVLDKLDAQGNSGTQNTPVSFSFSGLNSFAVSAKAGLQISEAAGLGTVFGGMSITELIDSTETSEEEKEPDLSLQISTGFNATTGVAELDVDWNVDLEFQVDPGNLPMTVNGNLLLSHNGTQFVLITPTITPNIPDLPDLPSFDADSLKQLDIKQIVDQLNVFVSQITSEIQGNLIPIMNSLPVSSLESALCFLDDLQILIEQLRDNAPSSLEELQLRINSSLPNYQNIVENMAAPLVSLNLVPAIVAGHAPSIAFNLNLQKALDLQLPLNIQQDFNGLGAISTNSSAFVLGHANLIFAMSIDLNASTPVAERVLLTQAHAVMDMSLGFEQALLASAQTVSISVQPESGLAILSFPTVPDLLVGDFLRIDGYSYSVLAIDGSQVTVNAVPMSQDTAGILIHNSSLTEIGKISYLKAVAGPLGLQALASGTVDLQAQVEYTDNDWNVSFDPPSETALDFEIYTDMPGIEGSLGHLNFSDLQAPAITFNPPPLGDMGIESVIAMLNNLPIQSMVSDMATRDLPVVNKSFNELAPVIDQLSGLLARIQTMDLQTFQDLGQVLIQELTAMADQSLNLSPPSFVLNQTTGVYSLAFQMGAGFNQSTVLALPLPAGMSAQPVSANVVGAGVLDVALSFRWDSTDGKLDLIFDSPISFNAHAKAVVSDLNLNLTLTQLSGYAGLVANFSATLGSAGASFVNGMQPQIETKILVGGQLDLAQPAQPALVLGVWSDSGMSVATEEQLITATADSSLWPTSGLLSTLPQGVGLVTGDAGNTTGALVADVRGLIGALQQFSPSVALDQILATLQNQVASLQVPMVQMRGESVTFGELMGVNPQTMINTYVAELRSRVQTKVESYLNATAAADRSLTGLKAYVLSQIEIMQSEIQNAASSLTDRLGNWQLALTDMSEQASESLALGLQFSKGLNDLGLGIADGLGGLNLGTLMPDLKLDLQFNIDFDSANLANTPIMNRFSFGGLGFNKTITPATEEVPLALNIGMLGLTCQSGELTINLGVDGSFAIVSDIQGSLVFTAMGMAGAPAGELTLSYDPNQGLKVGGSFDPADLIGFPSVGAGDVVTQINTFIQYLQNVTKTVADQVDVSVIRGAASRVVSFAEGIQQILFEKDSVGNYVSQRSLIKVDQASGQLLANFANAKELADRLQAIFATHSHYFPTNDLGESIAPLIDYVLYDESTGSVTEPNADSNQMPDALRFSLALNLPSLGLSQPMTLALAEALGGGLLSVQSNSRVNLSASGELSFNLIMRLDGGAVIEPSTTLENFKLVNNNATVASFLNQASAVMAAKPVEFGALTTQAQIAFTTGTNTITAQINGANDSLVALASELQTALTTQSANATVMAIDGRLHVLSPDAFRVQAGAVPGSYSELGFANSRMQTAVVGTVFSSLNLLSEGRVTLNLEVQALNNQGLAEGAVQVIQQAITVAAGQYHSIENLIQALNARLSERNLTVGSNIGTSLAAEYGLYAMGQRTPQGSYQIIIASDPSRLEGISPSSVKLTGAQQGSANLGMSTTIVRHMLQSRYLQPTGRLGQGIELSIQVGNHVSATLSLSADVTKNNARIEDLVTDLNLAIGGHTDLNGLVQVFQVGNTLGIKALNGDVLKVTQSGSSQQLGFANTQITGNTRDLRLVTSNGAVFEIELGALSESSTVQDLLNVLNNTSNRVSLTQGTSLDSFEFSIAGDHLVVKESGAQGTGTLRVYSINSSQATELLGLANQGMYTVTTAGVGNAQIDGGALVGLDLTERFVFQNIGANFDVNFELGQSFENLPVAVEFVNNKTVATLTLSAEQLAKGQWVAGNHLLIEGQYYKIIQVDSVNAMVQIDVQPLDHSVAALTLAPGQTQFSQVMLVSQITAAVGPVGVTALGSASFSAGAQLSFEHEGNTSFTLMHLIENLSAAAFETNLTYTAEGVGFDVYAEGLDFGTLNGKQILSANVGRFDLGELLNPVATQVNTASNALTDTVDWVTDVAGTGLNFYELVQNQLSSLSLDQILSLLEQVAGKMSSITANMDQNIPLIDKSIHEMVDIGQKIFQVVNQVRRMGLTSLQGLESYLNSALRVGLGMAENAIPFKLQLQPGTQGENAQIMVSLDFKMDFESRDNFNFTQGGKFISGNAELYTLGSIEFAADLSLVKGDQGFELRFGQEALSLNAQLMVSGDRLNFSLGLGGDAMPILSNLIEVGGQDVGNSYIGLAGRFNASMGEAGENIGSIVEDSISIQADVNVGGRLPVKLAGHHLGDLKIGVWESPETNVMTLDELRTWLNGTEAGVISEENYRETGLAIGLRTLENEPNLVNGNAVVDLYQVTEAVGALGDLSNLGLFDKLKLAVEGLDFLFSNLQEKLDEGLAEDLKNAPVVGASLAQGADFVAVLQNRIIDPLREFIYSAAELDAQAMASYLNSLLQNTGYLLDFEETRGNVTERALWGRVWNQSAGKVQYRYDAQAQEAEWAFTLGDDYDLGSNVDLNLGFPGLGLKTEGGVDLELSWVLSLGFGISESRGFYVILPSGEELTLQVSAQAYGTLLGSLGILGLKADANQGQVSASATIGLDLNAGSSTTDMLGAQILSLDPSIDYSAEATVNLPVTLGIVSDLKDANAPAFPNLNANFDFYWQRDLAGSGGLVRAGFKDIKLDMGSFVTKVLGPIIAKIKTITDPIQPLVDFLTTPFPVLDDLGMSITPLDLAKKFGGNNFDDGMIYALKDLMDLANTISGMTGAANMQVDLGDYMFVDDDLSDPSKLITNVHGGEFIRGISTPAINSQDRTVREQAIMQFSSTMGQHGGNANDAADALKAGIKDSLSANGGSEILARSAADEGEPENDWRGGTWKFFWNDPSQALGLLMGRPMMLVEYDMPPLTFNFDWNEFFRIWGPLGARVGVNFGATIDLAFGYDTLGVQNWIASGDIKNVGALVDGFYVKDTDENGNDVNEVTLYGGLSAAAELNAGVSAGVGGGVNIDVGFDLYDPDQDGRVRLNEMYYNMVDSGLGPLGMFDIHGEIYARLYAYVDLLFYTKRWNITDPITIVSFDVQAPRLPIMAQASGDNVVANVGANASNRLNGNTQDGSETVTYTLNNKEVNSNAFNGSNASSASVAQVGENGVFMIDAGAGNDRITLSGNANFNIEINGGEGDDVIDLSGLTLGANYYVVIRGGAGNDVIVGSKGRDIIFGDDGDYRSRTDENGNLQIVAEAKADPAIAGHDTIFGNLGDDLIFGGAGNDQISGNGSSNGALATGVSDNDILIGDGGRWTRIVSPTGIVVSELIDKTQTSLVGGADIIMGDQGNDILYGGLGNDKMHGGSGNDMIFGEKGHDLIQGGSGDDIIDAGHGMDVVFGDTFAGNSFDVNAVFSQSAFTQEFIRQWGALSGTSWDIAVSSYLATTNKISGFSSEVDTGVAGSDNIQGGLGSDVIFGDAGDSTGAADFIQGGLDNDLIDGDGGDDTLEGNTGDDVIFGGAGDDIIRGGAGDDALYGDAGVQGYAVANAIELSGNELILGTNLGVGQKIYLDRVYNSQESGDDVIDVGSGMDFVDGQAGNDLVQVFFSGGNTLGVVNVMDSGADSSSMDRLVIRGTEANDSILVRSNDPSQTTFSTSSDEPAMGTVALVPELQLEDAAPGQITDSTKTNVERVNFWRGGVDQVMIDAAGGNDTIALDGTAAHTTISGGVGDDVFQVGQIFKSERNSQSAVHDLDTFATTETTQGFLSQGVSAGDNVFLEGDTGKDSFNIYHNVGSVSLSGGSGNDDFNTQGFVHANAADGVVSNGPMSIDGGAGTDTMTIRGSEAGDTFVISKQGFASNVGSADVQGVENTHFDGAAGDDTFDIIGNNPEDSTVIYGGLGNDTVNNGGSQEGLVLRSANLKGHTGLIEHSIDQSAETADPAFENASISNARFNVVDTSLKPAIIYSQSDLTQVEFPGLELTEGGSDSFWVAVTHLPSGIHSATLNLTAAMLSDGRVQRGDRGVWLSLKNDGTDLTQNLEIQLNALTLGQRVYVYAPADGYREGVVHSTITVSGVAVHTDGHVEALDQTQSVSVTVLDRTTSNQIDLGLIARTDSVAITAEHSGTIALASLPSSVAQIRVYRDDHNEALSASDYTVSGQSLILNTAALQALKTAGATVMIHYSTNIIELDGQSSVNLAYEQAVVHTVQLGVETLQRDVPAQGAAYYYKLQGGQVQIFSANLHRMVGVKGTLILNGYLSALAIESGLDLVEGSTSTAPVAQTGAHVIIEQDANTVVEGSTVYRATYTVKLSQAPSDGKTVSVIVDPAQTAWSQTLSGVQRADQLEIRVLGSTEPATSNPLTITFDSASNLWSNGITIEVFGKADVLTEDRSIVESPAALKNIDEIDGSVYVNGAGNSADAGLIDPLMMSYNHRISNGQGAMIAAIDETNSFSNISYIDNMAGLSIVIPASVVEAELGTLTDSQLASALWHRTITLVQGSVDGNQQLRRIDSVEKIGAEWRLTLNASFQVDESVEQYGYLLTGNRDALFVNENESVDRFFVNNQNHSFDANVNIDRLADAQNWTDSPSEQAIEWAQQPGAMRFTHSAIGEEGLNFVGFEYAEINLGSGQDQVNVQATMSRADGYQTVTALNTGNESETDADGESISGDVVHVISYKATPLNRFGAGTMALDPQAAEGSHAYVVNSYQLPDSLSLGTSLQGYFVDVVVAEGLVERREVVSALWNSSTLVQIVLDRPVSGNGSYGFTLVGTSVTQGVAPEESHYTYANGFVTLLGSDLSQVRAGDVLVLLNQGSDTLLETRVVVKSVSGVVVAVYGEIQDSTFEQFRVERYENDGILAINAQGGNDTIDAFGDTNGDGVGHYVVNQPLVLFGGLGNDTIKTADQGIVFGDRGQVIYRDEQSGAVVTILGSTDQGSDYTTESNLAESTTAGLTDQGKALWQTDGVRREAVEYRSMSNDQGGHDTITVHGEKNFVFGGQGEDQILIKGGNNVAFGDGGRLELATLRPGADLQWGDQAESRITKVESTADSQGASDTLEVQGAGRNVIFGGAMDDTLTSADGDDIIVGDGGVVNFTTQETWLNVSNAGYGVSQDGNDTIDAGIGLNTVLGGLGDDLISTGVDLQSEMSDVRERTSNHRDVVLGDNGTRTFEGSGEHLNGQDQSTLSFNFKGAASQGLSATTVAGAQAFEAANWNNIQGNLSGIGPSSYGNNPGEFVLNDQGQRMEGLTLSYGGSEGHRTQNIELNAYALEDFNPSQVQDGWLFAGGVRTSAPNTQSGNKLEVEMDGLSKYFSEYKVVVYLDASRNVSSLLQNPQDSVLAQQLGSSVGESIRKVAIREENQADRQAFYLDDAADANNGAYNTFNGTYHQAVWTSAQEAFGHYANYVVFEGLTADRFVVTITDGVINVNFNGRDLPSIAGIQIIGTSHAVDRIESSRVEAGGNDTIRTGGGSDVVIGGAGSDTIITYGDIRDGIDDADLVIGDNGLVIEMLRPGMVAETNYAQTTDWADIPLYDATFNDTIVTGNGNDVVLGGEGQDHILTGRQDQLSTGLMQELGMDPALASFAVEGLKVISVNFSYSYNDSSKNDADLRVTQGAVAGVVPASNWNNLILRPELNPVQNPHPYTNTSFTLNDGSQASGLNFRLKAEEPPFDDATYTSLQVDRSNAHDQIDADSDNARLMESYYWAQQQQEIEIDIAGIKQQSGFDVYDVYVYIDGDSERTDSDNFVYAISGGNYSVANGMSTYYVNDWKGHTFNGEFKEVTATSYALRSQGVVPNMEMVGNYVVFRNVTAETFSIRIKNAWAGSQSPMNQPSVAGIQIVGGTARQSVAQTQSAPGQVPRHGDFDKDVVLGDNGAVRMTLDIPFGVNDQPEWAENKVYHAQSFTESYVGTSAPSQSDFISTGLNQDLVLGGNGSDVIDGGAGADVLLGDNAKVEMHDYNPIGVRMPLSLQILDNQEQDQATYIGQPNFNAGNFKPFELKGVSLVSSAQGGQDLIDAGSDNDLVYGQEGADVIILNQGKMDVAADTGLNTIKSRDGAYASSSAYLADLTNVLAMLDQEGDAALQDLVDNDFGPTTSLGHIYQNLPADPTEPEDPVEPPVVIPTYDIGSGQELTLNLQAGQEVMLTANQWPGWDNPWWNPNIVLVLNNAGNAIPQLSFEVTANGTTQNVGYSGGGWYSTVDIADTGAYQIKVRAVTSGSFRIRLGNQ